MGIFFITGTGTGIGKTFVTGQLARKLIEKGKTVITVKPVQTGCSGISEDITVHRKIMGKSLYPEDTDFITCPYVFAYPASPHLAARLENRNIDISTIDKNIELVNSRFEFVLIEGSGGICTPLTEEVDFLEYAAKHNYPVIFVTGYTLGSISYTVTAIELMKHRGMNIHSVILNTLGEYDNLIAESTLSYLRKKYPEITITETIESLAKS